MELIETSKETKATVGVMLEASASALTQGKFGTHFENYQLAFPIFH